jgi:hypothetical protein
MFKILQLLGLKPKTADIIEAVLKALATGAKPIDVLQEVVEKLLGDSVPTKFLFDLLKKMLAKRQVSEITNALTFDGKPVTMYSLPR